MTSDEAQIRTQSELQPGETLVWSGLPDPRRIAIGAVPETLLPGILFFGVGVFLVVYAYSVAPMTPKSAANARSQASGVALVAPFFLLGLINLLRPVWAYVRGHQTVYAVTNRRIMIIRGSVKGSVSSLSSGRIADVQCRGRRNGTGDVRIKAESNYTVGNSRNVLDRKRWWFYGIQNAKEVARQVSACMVDHSRRNGD